VADFFARVAALACVKRVYIGRTVNPGAREKAHRQKGVYHLLFPVCRVGGHRLAQESETLALRAVAAHLKLGNKARDSRGAYRRGLQHLYVAVRVVWPATRLCRTETGRESVRRAINAALKTRLLP
jgi:hypothetical protein